MGTLSTELAWLKDMGTVNYPFTETPPPSIRDLIADMSFVYPQDILPTTSGKADVFLTRFSQNNGNIDVILKTKDDVTLFTTSGITPTINTFGAWKTFSWKRPIGSALRLVLKSSLVGAGFGQTYAGGLRLCAKNVTLMAPRITAILLKQVRVSDANGNLSGTPTDYRLEGPVRLVEGYNVHLAPNGDFANSDIITPSPPEPVDPGQPPQIAPAARFVLNQNLVVNVIPGAGQGKYSDCATASSVLRTINGKKSDQNGNFALLTDDCYRLERPVFFPEGAPPEDRVRQGFTLPGVLELTGGCTSCTDCQEYSDSYKQIGTVSERLNLLLERTKTSINNYRALLAMLKPLQARMDRPAVRWRMLRSGDAVYTFHVQLRTGTATYDKIQCTFTPPAGYTANYVKYNGWEELPGLERRQNDALFSATAGMNWNQEATFYPRTVSNWSWTVRLTKDTGGHGLSQVKFMMTASARITKSDPAQFKVFTPLYRQVEVRY